MYYDNLDSFRRRRRRRSPIFTMFSISASSSAAVGGSDHHHHHHHHHLQKLHNPHPHPHIQQQQQQQRQLLNLQQQLLIHQPILQQQAALFHPAQISVISQIESVPSGNLLPGFDSASSCSLYVGNIHKKVTVTLLAEVFATIGPLFGCKLIKRNKSSYGFVDYLDNRTAAAAILTLNGKQMFKQPIKVNWAYTSKEREATTGYSYDIFVGNLSSAITDAALFANFSIYPSCLQAHVMWDPRSGRSKGFGFVSFGDQQDAERAIREMTGKCLGSRVIRCNWATKSEEIMSQNLKSTDVLTIPDPNSDISVSSDAEKCAE